MSRIDINKELFSYIAPPYPLIMFPEAWKSKKPKEEVFTDIEALWHDSDTGYINILGKSILMPVMLDGVWLPNSIFNIQRSKRIIETVLTGRKGTVKEFISAEDYKIKIQGTIIHEYKGTSVAYPLQDLTNLLKILDKSEALKIENELMSQLGIHSVVVYDYDVSEIGKNENVQRYEINLKSDGDFVAENVDIIEMLQQGYNPLANIF
jgi:hypothetical protein